MLSQFGLGAKSNKVGNDIDSKVNAGKLVLQNAHLSLQQLDFIEQQLTQLAQQLQGEAPMIAMTFTNLVNQLNNNQQQVANAVRQAEHLFHEIDALTDKIQH